RGAVRGWNRQAAGAYRTAGPLPRMRRRADLAEALWPDGGGLGFGRAQALTCAGAPVRCALGKDRLWRDWVGDGPAQRSFTPSGIAALAGPHDPNLSGGAAALDLGAETFDLVRPVQHPNFNLVLPRLARLEFDQFAAPARLFSSKTVGARLHPNRI